MSTAPHLLLKRWSLQVISPSEVVPELQLPEFSHSATPTSDLINFIDGLSIVKYPNFYRNVTIAADTVLAFYLVVGSYRQSSATASHTSTDILHINSLGVLVMLWRAFRRTFWWVSIDAVLSKDTSSSHSLLSSAGKVTFWFPTLSTHLCY